jgi:hypothetical protein
MCVRSADYGMTGRSGPRKRVCVQLSQLGRATGFDREFGHRLIVNLDSVRSAIGRESRHHRATVVAAQRYPIYLPQPVGATRFRSGRRAEVLPKLTNTESSDAEIRDQGVEITANLRDRIAEAKACGWTGEVEGLASACTPPRPNSPAWTK